MLFVFSACLFVQGCHSPLAVRFPPILSWTSPLVGMSAWPSAPCLNQPLSTYVPRAQASDSGAQRRAQLDAHTTPQAQLFHR